MIVHEHWNMFTVPMVLFAIDGIVVIIAALNFGVQAGLFALVSLYTSTKTMDSIIKGFNTAMQFLIISARQEEIIRRIHTELERGCTRLEATGTYEGRKNGTLLCVVSRMEASRLKKIVSECDPHAFGHRLRRARSAGRGIQLSSAYGLTSCTKSRAICETWFTKQDG